MILAPGDAQGLLDSIVAQARKAAPGAQISASLTSGRFANTRFARNEITSTGDVDETTVTIGVTFGKRSAGTTTNQTDGASLRAAIDNAVRLAKLAPEDPEHMPPLGPQRYRPSPAARDLATERLDAAARAEAARVAVAAAESAGLQIAGFYEHDGTTWALANSAGLHAAHRSTGAGLTMTARTSDGTGSGWAGAFSNRAADLDAGTLARVAVDKAVRSAKPQRLDPGRYTVVLEAAAVGGLLWFLAGSLDARRADEGRSFFSRAGGGTRVGEKVFGEAITLTSDPLDAETPGAPFDGDGVPLKRMAWIDGGLLRDLIYSRFWAAKQGKQPTGTPGVFKLAGGTASAPDLLTGVQRGVLITRFWYANLLDPQTVLVTGLTRDGVFLIENGEVTAPVNNFRFNESPITVLKNADALTRATIRLPDGDGRMRVPALRTHEFNLASVSEAV